MNLRYLIVCFLLAACSSPPGGELTQSTRDAGGDADPPTDTPVDAASPDGGGGAATDARDASPDTPRTDVADTMGDGAEAGGTSDVEQDTRPHWDAGVDCQPGTICCDDGQPQNGGEACDDGVPSTERTECQQGACRACECAEGACCDGCFFEARGEECSSGGYKTECRGGDENKCGARLYETLGTWRCTGYSAACPEEPAETTTSPAAERCASDRECTGAVGYPCSAEIQSDCN